MASTTTKATKPLLTDLASTIDRVPSNFIRPLADRPNLHQLHSSSPSIPIIDLHDFHGPNRSKIIQNLAHACQHYGFFQVYTKLHLMYTIKLFLMQFNHTNS